MLNIFRFSPTKTQEQTSIDSESLLIKQFNGLDIQVYGTYEEPLFKAKDIGKLLEMSNIRETIKNFNNKQKVVSLTDTLGGEQETTFLTEQGLYKVLMRSRKKIAEQFQDWVCEVVEEIRRKGKYDLEEKLKEQERLLEEKDRELTYFKEKTYEEIEKTGHIYVIQTDGGTKVGKTKDTVIKRIKGLQTGNVNEIQILMDYKTSNADLLERCVHYILDRYRCNSNREFFDCDVNYIKMVVRICGKVIDTLKSSFQTISCQELMDKLEFKVEINHSIDSICQDELLDELSSYSSINETTKFYKWLDENIDYSNENDYIDLKTICELYLGKSNIHSNVSTKYKKELEKWIKEKFPTIEYKYDQLKIKHGENLIRPRGWAHIKFINN
jgi:prophage antirepressor-like protein